MPIHLNKRTLNVVVNNNKKKSKTKMHIINIWFLEIFIKFNLFFVVIWIEGEKY